MSGAKLPTPPPKHTVYGNYKRADYFEAECARLTAELALLIKDANVATAILGDRCEMLDASLQSYAEMLGRLQPNRPLNVHCPKCGRDMPECVGEPPCYYQSKDGNQALEAAADEVLRVFMPQFNDSRAVDDCLVGLAAAVCRVPLRSEAGAAVRAESTANPSLAEHTIEDCIAKYIPEQKPNE